MATCYLVRAAFLLGFAVGFSDMAWGPDDSTNALDIVVETIKKVASNPHLSKEHMVKAQQVVKDVSQDIEAVESGKLTKPQAQEKIAFAIKELEGFEANLHAPSAAEAKMAALQKQLDDKRAQLAKAQEMMKLYKMKEQLAEKKLLLQKLLAQKANADENRKSEQEEATKSKQVVNGLFAAAKSLDNAKTHEELHAQQELPAPLKGALESIQARERNLSSALAQLDAKQHEADAELDKAMASASKGTSDAVSKGHSVLEMLKKQEHRKFAKAAALKKAELKELKDAEESIQKRNVTSLQRVLVKMEAETKTLDARSRNFLY